MDIPAGITFEYGMDPDSARYYGVIRLPNGEFLTTGSIYHSVDDAEQKAEEILRELWRICAEANRADGVRP